MTFVSALWRLRTQCVVTHRLSDMVGVTEELMEPILPWVQYALKTPKQNNVRLLIITVMPFVALVRSKGEK